jgi:hypothetical protein
VYPEQGAVWVSLARNFLTEYLGVLYLALGVGAGIIMAFMAFGEIPQCDAVACKNDAGALFFNGHIADMPIEDLYDFYAAYL